MSLQSPEQRRLAQRAIGLDDSRSFQLVVLRGTRRFLDHIIERNPNATPFPIRSLNLQQGDKDTRGLITRVVNVLMSVCRLRLSPDFIASALVSNLRKRSYYIIAYDNNGEIASVCMSFLDKELQDRVLTDSLVAGSDLYRLLSSNPVVYTMILACSRRRGAGRMAIEAMENEVLRRPCLLVVHRPVVRLRDYYENIGFVYEDITWDRHKIIYKVLP